MSFHDLANSVLLSNEGAVFNAPEHLFLKGSARHCNNLSGPQQKPPPKTPLQPKNGRQPAIAGPARTSPSVLGLFLADCTSILGRPKLHNHAADCHSSLQIQGDPTNDFSGLLLPSSTNLLYERFLKLPQFDCICIHRGATCGFFMARTLAATISMNLPNPDNLTPLGDLTPTPDQPVDPQPAAAPPQTPTAPSMDESKSPEELVAWGLQHFADQPIVMTSSFGMEGCMLMDMCSKAIAKHKLPKLTIACIDTGFFFPETKQLQKKLIERYDNLDFVTWETPVSIEQQAKSYGPNLWQYNPNLCCNIRKVQPMSENVVNYNVWITAVRRSQTASRANTPVMGWDWRYQLLKFCPLVTLSRADVWSYIQKHEVPFNQLHLQNYPSVSCFHCTKAVPGSSPDSDARGGRWSDTDKDECGLHYQI